VRASKREPFAPQAAQFVVLLFVNLSPLQHDKGRHFDRPLFVLSGSKTAPDDRVEKSNRQSFRPSQPPLRFVEKISFQTD
jgi:hypothetical protein